jgi:hypothetical protein
VVKPMASYFEILIELISSNRVQYLVYTGLSVLVFGFAVIVYLSNRLVFQRFLGDINPLVAFLVVILLGFALFSILLYKNWFVIYGPQNRQGILVAAGLASLFGVVIILVDTKAVFPPTMNVLFPESLSFYPAIGFFAEILFHVLPVTVLMVTLSAIFKKTDQQMLIWISILLVSLLEPIYQASNMASSNQYSLWVVVYTGVHIFLLNLCQLLIFKRYDFVSMYTFRLVYYMFWHIGWGYLRLRLLF